MDTCGPAPFKVYRRPEGEPDEPQRWYRLRQGVADLHRRADICQNINGRYYDAFAKVDTDTTLDELIAAIQRPLMQQEKRYRALQPFGAPDVQLLEAICRGEFLIQGLRNRDLQGLLYAQPASGKQEHRQRSAAVSRRLRLLRAHGLLRKVSTTHRYHVTARGREILSAILAARKTTLKHLNTQAA